jgi:group II intron reverse transcriptase/maturase
MLKRGGKSDGRVVPEKPANNGPERSGPAERVEGRRPAKENPSTADRDRTQSRANLEQELARVREVARTRPDEKFTALWHHVYNPERLHEVYLQLGRDAAAGVDGVTWRQYGENLGANLEDLSDRLRRGAYRPAPVRRVYIPKSDGRQRPIGIPTLEDKIVQRATVQVLEAVYETAFLPFSYGFRPGRNQHSALDALAVGITRMKVNYVLDADIRGFFDTIDHEWMIRFIEHRIADQRVVTQIRKWMRAGVLEDGVIVDVEQGTPQGGSISPLLANIYLHYVFDLWVQQWRNRHARGDVIVVRYADDFIVGFQHESDARRLLEELRARLHEFKLELHPDKTRLIEFGRYTAERRARRGEGKPETFDFLGFTHICGTDRKGRFSLRRQTSRKKLRAKLADLKQEIRRRAFRAHRKMGPWLRSVMKGHFNYYGVPLNFDALRRFRDEVVKLWMRALRRLSQRHRKSWKRMKPLIARWIPRPRIVHPFPDERLVVSIRGRSPVR